MVRDGQFDPQARHHPGLLATAYESADVLEHPRPLQRFGGVDRAVAHAAPQRRALHRVGGGQCVRGPVQCHDVLARLLLEADEPAAQRLAAGGDLHLVLPGGRRPGPQRRGGTTRPPPTGPGPTPLFCSVPGTRPRLPARSPRTGGGPPRAARPGRGRAAGPAPWRRGGGAAEVGGELGRGRRTPGQHGPVDALVERIDACRGEVVRHMRILAHLCQVQQWAVKIRCTESDFGARTSSHGQEPTKKPTSGGCHGHHRRAGRDAHRDPRHRDRYVTRLEPTGHRRAVRRRRRGSRPRRLARLPGRRMPPPPSARPDGPWRYGRTPSSGRYGKPDCTPPHPADSGCSSTPWR